MVSPDIIKFGWLLKIGRKLLLSPCGEPFAIKSCFWLKSVGSTYQRAMVMLFHDMMHKEIEVYVDDLIAKS